MRIGVLTDVHLAPPGSAPVIWHSELLFADAGERYSRALATLAEHDPEVIVVLGDLTHFGDAESMDEFLTRTADASCPVLLIAGNHDVVPEDDALKRGISRIIPAHTSQLGPTVQVGALSFLGVDVTSVAGDERYAARGITTSRPGTVVLSHFPVIGLEEECAAAGVRYAGDLQNRAELERAVRLDGSPSLVLCGHLHLRMVASSGSVLQLAFGALIEAPFDLAIADIELDERGGSVRVEQLGPEVDCAAAIAERSYGFEFSDGEWRRTA
jgi:DNA repair exonuclease SbcCD nuclease subunit